MAAAENEKKYPCHECRKDRSVSKAGERCRACRIALSQDIGRLRRERRDAKLCLYCDEPHLPKSSTCDLHALGEKELNPKKVGIDALVDQFERFRKKHPRLFPRHYDPEPEPKRKHRKKSPPPKP